MEKNPCCIRTWPTPRQVGQVVGLVPGLAPLPAQVAQPLNYTWAFALALLAALLLGQRLRWGEMGPMPPRSRPRLDVPVLYSKLRARSKSPGFVAAPRAGHYN